MSWAVFAPFISATKHSSDNMVTNLINSAILSALQTLLNHLLSLDSQITKKLKSISGKSLAVHCKSPELIVTLQICDDRILLFRKEVTERDNKPSNEQPAADTTITGSASSLLKLVATKNTAALRDDGIVITGDTALLTSLQEILRDLDVDWEYQLSKFIGDIPTQAVSDGVTATRNFTRRTSSNLQQDVSDYLLEERKFFPLISELEDFYFSIDALRMRLDRLESRVKHLQNS